MIKLIQVGTCCAPSMSGLPEFRNVVLEEPDPVGPFGAKAICERRLQGSWSLPLVGE